jgi:hypothetical protein
LMYRLFEMVPFDALSFFPPHQQVFVSTHWKNTWGLKGCN